MKGLSNDIVLRPRFQFAIPLPKETVLSAFDHNQQPPFITKRLDEHVFIKFNASERHFWSPQLHLELEEIDAQNSKLYGVFGPNPTLWTFFMFLHFGIATIFIILGVWAYSSAALGKDYAVQVILMTIMIVFWFAFYAFGRLGKKKGKPQMHQLYQFMQHSIPI